MTGGRRIHILGASGSGTSTLARGLATALSSQSFDTDDFYWCPTDPPFQQKRPVAERLALMEALFLPRSDWVLSGSFTAWGQPIVDRLTHVVFVSLPSAQRLARLRRRERRRAERDGAAAMQPGFLEWAMAYDDPAFIGRSRAEHESWLSTLPCPVIRIDARPPAEVVLARTLQALDHEISYA